MKKNIIVGVSGASGVIYGIRLIGTLLQQPLAVYAVVSPSAWKVIDHELKFTAELPLCHFNVWAPHITFWAQDTELQRRVRGLEYNQSCFFYRGDEPPRRADDSAVRPVARRRRRPPVANVAGDSVRPPRQSDRDRRPAPASRHTAQELTARSRAGFEQYS